MQWTKPEYQEITLNMEVTGYVNTDGEIRKPAEPFQTRREGADDDHTERRER